VSRLRNVRIMVLDDHRNMRMLWRGMLLGFGIRNVIEAGSARDALEQLQQTDVDAIIVDHHLGDMTGSEFVEVLRKGSDSPAPHVPIIACTADTRRVTIRLMIDAGADEILAKPVSSQQAWDKLVTVVNNRRNFVRCGEFFGPDRRRRKSPYFGDNERREVRDSGCFID